MRLRTLDLGEMERFAVISDVHLRDPEDERTQIFCQAMASLNGVDTLFLLGDIFDFIFVGHPFFVDHWAVVFDACAQVVDHGVRVVFVEGNHDFGFEHCFPETLKKSFTTAGDVKVQLKHTKLGNVWLLHGDNVICPQNYHSFRNFVKSATLQRFARPFVGKLSHLGFSQWARLSRGRDAYRELSPEYVSCTANRYLASAGENAPQVLILGHIHVDMDGKLNETRLISGPDWFTAPSILFCDGDGSISRRYLVDVVVPRFHLA